MGELLAWAVFQMFVRHKEWSPEYEPQLSSAFWRRYAPNLASELVEEAWGQQ